LAAPAAVAARGPRGAPPSRAPRAATRPPRLRCQPLATPPSSGAEEEEEEEAEEEEEEDNSSRRRGGGGGFGQKTCVLSEEMQAFLGAERMTRPQVVKAIWAYIKEKGLQVCGVGGASGLAGASAWAAAAAAGGRAGADVRLVAGTLRPRPRRLPWAPCCCGQAPAFSTLHLTLLPPPPLPPQSPQDPANKRRIIVDEKLSTIFTPPIDMFSMNKQISKHVKASDEVANGGGSGDEGGGGRPAAKRRASGPSGKRKRAAGGGGGGAKKARGMYGEMRVSDALAAVVGRSQMTRSDLTKWFWAYVKENNLQVRGGVSGRAGGYEAGGEARPLSEEARTRARQRRGCARSAAARPACAAAPHPPPASRPPPPLSLPPPSPGPSRQVVHPVGRQPAEALRRRPLQGLRLPKVRQEPRAGARG
jgi:chromatin remodeling complex protein RSC6